MGALTKETAACLSLKAAALVFFPPIRDTFLPGTLTNPMAAMPRCPEGANEGAIEEEEEEEQQLGGVEASRRNLDFGID